MNNQTQTRPTWVQGYEAGYTAALDTKSQPTCNICGEEYRDLELMKIDTPQGSRLACFNCERDLQVKCIIIECENEREFGFYCGECFPRFDEGSRP